MNPWSHFEPASCLPAKCQCEAPLDEWIRQPSSFWSSASYILAAFFLIRFSRLKSPGLKAWAIVCSLMGASSMVGHGTFTRLGLSFDFASIVLIISFFFVWKLFQNFRFSYLKITFYLCLYYLSLVVLMYSLDKWTKIITCVVIFTLAFLDLTREMNSNLFKQKTLMKAMLIFLLSFAFFILDEAHIACNPYSLFQLHSIWHFGTAISAYLLGKWRFDEIRSL
jgi:hypothetical protein